MGSLRDREVASSAPDRLCPEGRFISPSSGSSPGPGYPTCVYVQKNALKPHSFIQFAKPKDTDTVFSFSWKYSSLIFMIIHRPSELTMRLFIIYMTRAENLAKNREKYVYLLNTL